MKVIVLDLSEPNCHACGNPLLRDTSTQKERCIFPGCRIRNVDFTIPTIPEKKDE